MDVEVVFKKQNSAIENLLKNCNKDSFDGVCDEIDCKSNIVVFNYTPRESIYVYAVVNKTSWRNNKNKFQENDLFKNRFEDFVEKIIIVDSEIHEEKLKEGIINNNIETILGQDNQNQVSIIYQCSEPSMVSIKYVLGDVFSVDDFLFYRAFVQLTVEKDKYSIKGWHSPKIPFKKIFDIKHKKSTKATTEEIVEQPLTNLENPTSCMKSTECESAKNLEDVVRSTIKQSKTNFWKYEEELMDAFRRLEKNINSKSFKAELRVKTEDPERKKRKKTEKKSKKKDGKRRKKWKSNGKIEEKSSIFLRLLDSYY